MRTLLQINTVINSSATGRITKDIGDLALKKGWESYIYYGRKGGVSNSSLIKTGNTIDTYFHVAKTRLLDKHGLGSSYPTKALIKKIQLINPDIIHLHNLHGYYINYQLLFDYLKSMNIHVVWTLHDCWSFTGHCTHFEFIDCNKWKQQCSKCPQKRMYPASIGLDNSTYNYRIKKECFGTLRNMTLVPVSTWLDELLKESFLSHYPSTVIQNGIDIEIFKPTKNKVKVLERYNLNNKFVILGVANKWNERKGLKDFIRLNEHLAEDEIIVIVGLDEKQYQEMPKNILALKRTESVEELASLYSIADIFINPTYEDTFPTTNLEAMACGTPVLSYRTGGAVEQVDQETGFIIEQGDILSSLAVIKQLKSSNHNDYEKKCIARVAKHYEKNTQFEKYIELYDGLLA